MDFLEEEQVLRYILSNYIKHNITKKCQAYSFGVLETRLEAHA